MKEKEFDQIKYQNQYIKENYDRIGITLPKGQKAIIKEKAIAAGESTNEYIYKATMQRMKNEEQI